MNHITSEELRRHYAGVPVLITGGLGFIGSNLAIRLAQYGARVTVLDSLIPQFGGNRANIAPMETQISVNISDMRDTNSLRVLVRDQQHIFHLAGQVSHGDSMRDPELDLGVNCISTINLVEACRQVNPTARLLYTSTRQVYGIPRDLPVKENHPALPIDVNGINKLAAEYYHLLYDRTYGLRSTILRLTNTYGPRQQLRNNRQGFISVFLQQALKGERLTIFGTGLQIRDFNYVDDVVTAILCAAVTDACYGDVFNLGAPTYYSLLEFVQILARFCEFAYELQPFPEDRRIIDIGDYYGDYARFTAVTGWQPVVDLEEGLQRTVEFYRNHLETYLQ